MGANTVKGNATDSTGVAQVTQGAESSSIDSVTVVQGAAGLTSVPWNVRSGDGTRLATHKSDGALPTNTETAKLTYSAGVVGQVPGTAATDILTIHGAANKIVTVTRISFSGTATNGGVLVVQLVKRSAVDTSGTPTTLIAVPHDSGSAAASAVVQTWASTPPSLGAAVGTIRSATAVLAQVTATTTAFNVEDLIWDFTTRNTQGIHLLTAAETLAVNLNGATILAGNLINMDIEWTEE